MNENEELTIAGRISTAAAELGDLVELFTNDEPNGEEVGKMLSEGAEAGMALYQLQKKVPKTDYIKGGAVFAAVVVGRIATDKVEFSDGSKIRIIVEPVAPVDVPQESPGISSPGFSGTDSVPGDTGVAR